MNEKFYATFTRDWNLSVEGDSPAFGQWTIAFDTAEERDRWVKKINKLGGSARAVTADEVSDEYGTDQWWIGYVDGFDKFGIVMKPDEVERDISGVYWGLNDEVYDMVFAAA